jgi:hypothetical protein
MHQHRDVVYFDLLYSLQLVDDLPDEPLRMIEQAL